MLPAVEGLWSPDEQPRGPWLQFAITAREVRDAVSLCGSVTATGAGRGSPEARWVGSLRSGSSDVAVRSRGPGHSGGRRVVCVAVAGPCRASNGRARVGEGWAAVLER